MESDPAEVPPVPLGSARESTRGSLQLPPSSKVTLKIRLGIPSRDPPLLEAAAKGIPTGPQCPGDDP